MRLIGGISITYNGCFLCVVGVWSNDQKRIRKRSIRIEGAMEYCYARRSWDDQINRWYARRHGKKECRNWCKGKWIIAGVKVKTGINW